MLRGNKKKWTDIHMLLKEKRMFWHDVVVPFVRVRHVFVIIPRSRRWFIFNSVENEHHHSLQRKKKTKFVEIQIFLIPFNYFVLRLVEGSNVEIPFSSFSLSCTYLAYKCKRKPLHCIGESLCFSLFLWISVCMGKSTACLFGAIVFLWCCISHVTSDASDHRYNKGDSVPFYANKVGPFHNPRSDFQSLFLLLTFTNSCFCFKTFQSWKIYIAFVLCYYGVTIWRMRFPLELDTGLFHLRLLLWFICNEDSMILSWCGFGFWNPLKTLISET